MTDLQKPVLGGCILIALALLGITLVVTLLAVSR